ESKEVQTYEKKPYLPQLLLESPIDRRLHRVFLLEEIVRVDDVRRQVLTFYFLLKFFFSVGSETVKALQVPEGSHRRALQVAYPRRLPYNISPSSIDSI